MSIVIKNLGKSITIINVALLFVNIVFLIKNRKDRAQHCYYAKYTAVISWPQILYHLNVVN